MNEWLYNLKFGFPICKMGSVNTEPVNFTALSNSTSCAQLTARPKDTKRSLEQRKVYCRDIQGEQVAHTPQNPEFPKGFQQIEGGAWLVIADFLV